MNRTRHDPVDEAENVALMTGAIYMALHMTDRFQDVRLDEGGDVPAVVVEIHFLQSPYRITVERLDEPKVSDANFEADGQGSD